MDAVDGEVKKLTGKKLASDETFDPGLLAPLQQLMQELTKEVDISPAVVLALDAPDDDYFRQAIWQYLMIYDAWNIDDLPILCQLFKKSIGAKSEMRTMTRVWEVPEALRTKMGRRIALLCHVADLSEEHDGALIETIGNAS